MKFTRIVGVFVVAALGLGLVACGDEKADAQSRHELVEAANAICDKYTKRFEKFDEPGNLRNTEKAAAYFDEAAPVYEAAVIDFKALDPNDDTKDDWNAYVAKQVELQDLTKKIADKAIKDDRSYINDLGQLAPLDDEGNEAARKVGANTCAKD